MNDDSNFILYAEDDPDDYYFFKASLAKIRPGYKLIHANNGMEAIDYLDSIKDGNPAPKSIIMDYNMPVMNGFHALRIIRAMEDYREIPAFLFTTSRSRDELDDYKKLNISIFWKGFSLQELEEQITAMLEIIEREL